MNPVQVIGCDGSGFTERVRAVLRGAELVLGGRRLLALAAPELREGAECIELGAELTAKLAEALRERNGRRMAVLASGDPLCCGIGGTLRRLAPEEVFEFHPAPTAFQQLFARLGEPWEGMTFFPLHGEPGALPFRRMLRSPLAVVYCDAKRTARHVAAELISRYPAASGRRAAVGCDLGLATEYVGTGTLAALAGDRNAERSLSLLALLPDETFPAPELPLGLADECYLHSKQMITHPEIRAVVLAKLRVAPGVMWDVGAGSGSVGLEAAGLCPALTVHAVEKNPERFAELEANCRNEGLKNIVARAGKAEEWIPLLPEPDRVFVGGGGAGLEGILRGC
ncbi:MAG: precorrin-6y C5,15-methyltransferase (decarboxylating) subunit CbiE, partial [Lentisphaeria bacterium]|nr:precorrin-6y C5,15-methyltransferase (decarboxylating) subunit CbiE [Lentisphaeria bacterium]